MPEPRLPEHAARHLGHRHHLGPGKRIRLAHGIVQKPRGGDTLHQVHAPYRALLRDAAAGHRVNREPAHEISKHAEFHPTAVANHEGRPHDGPFQPGFLHRSLPRTLARAIGSEYRIRNRNTRYIKEPADTRILARRDYVPRAARIYLLEGGRIV